MAMSISDIEKKYAALMRRENSPKSFSEYMRGVGYAPDRELGEAREAAVMTSAKKLSGYGTLTESLGALGLSGAGWSGYLKDAAIAERDAALDRVDEKELDAIGELKQDYTKYLTSYGEKQKSLRRNVIESLRLQREIEPEKIYKYAANAGLGEDAAKNLYSDVYSAVSYYIKDSILEKVYSSEISPKIAEEMAKSMMLQPKDVEEIRKIAEAYKSDISKESDDYVDYLESLGIKVTPTYKDSLFPSARTIKNKKGN